MARMVKIGSAGNIPSSNPPAPSFVKGHGGKVAFSSHRSKTADPSENTNNSPSTTTTITTAASTNESTSEDLSSPANFRKSFLLQSYKSPGGSSSSLSLCTTSLASSSAGEQPKKGFLDWDALDEFDKDDNELLSGAKTVSTTTAAITTTKQVVAGKAKINWANLSDEDEEKDDDEEEEEEEEEEEREEKQKTSLQPKDKKMIDWGALSDEDEDAVEEKTETIIPKKKKEIDWDALDDEEGGEEEEESNKQLEELSKQMKKRLWEALDEEFAEADWKGLNGGDDSDDDDAPQLNVSTSSTSTSTNSDALSKYQTVLLGAVNDYVKAREQKEKNVIHQGFLTKLGGKKRTKGWQRRWFVLTDTALSYFKKPGDVHEAGTISLESVTKVAGSITDGLKRHLIDVTTPQRNYVLSGETMEEQQHWITLLELEITRIQNKPPPSGGVVIKVVSCAGTESEVSKLIRIEASLSYDGARSFIIGKFGGITLPKSHSLWSRRTHLWLEDESRRLKAPIGYFIKQQDILEFKQRD